MPSSSAIPIVRSSDSDLNLIRSRNRSAAGSKSKLSYWPHWSNMNVLGSSNQRRSTDSITDLTEESLEAHNRKHAALIHSNKAYIVNKFITNDKCSPYYKGLIDATLSINRDRDREKNIIPDSLHLQLPLQIPAEEAGAASPGRESHAITFATNSSSSSLSSFILKIQHYWTTNSCFTFKTPSSSSSRPVDKAITNFTKGISILESKEISFLNSRNINHTDYYKEKPLRERVSPDHDQPQPPKMTTTGECDDNKDILTVDDMVNQRFIWAKKYEPKALEDFICNRDKATQLQGKMRESGCGHFIFEGPPGVGKRTMIRAMLREAFGPDGVETKDKCKAFDLKGEMIGRIQVNMKESLQHVEINLSDMKGYEKHVIVELMKETQTRISGKALQSNPVSCQAIVLCEADKLSNDALLYIRWLFERYKGCNNFFFCCSDVSKLQPIKALCTVVQLFPPSKQEIIQVLELLARQEGIDLSSELAEKVANNSKNNLRQAIRSFEASCSYPFKEGEDQVILTGWEDDMANIAKNIIEEQSPKQLYIIRGKLKNLIEHDVSPEFIFKSLVEELKKHLDEQMQLQVDNLYEEYNGYDGSIFDSEKPLVFPRSRHNETSRKKNVKHFLRIEEFIAKFMSCYSNQSRKTNVHSVAEHQEES